MSENDQTRKDRQFQYDLAQVQGFDAWVSIFIAMVIFGFTLVVSALQLPSQYAGLAQVIFWVGMAFIYSGNVLMFWLGIKKGRSTSKFKEKYGLV